MTRTPPRPTAASQHLRQSPRILILGLQTESVASMMWMFFGEMDFESIDRLGLQRQTQPHLKQALSVQIYRTSRLEAGVVPSKAAVVSCPQCGGSNGA